MYLFKKLKMEQYEIHIQAQQLYRLRRNNELMKNSVYI